ncbi:blue light receptor, variant 2 [Coniochaeta pulveracea]|nr:blue light receptor, variant 2 [Coniochaeta pulveracea]
MLSFMDGSGFNGFDGLPSFMNMNGPGDGGGGMVQPFAQSAPAPAAQPTLIPAGAQNLGSADDARNVPGAGPVPATGFNAQAQLSNANTLTEFTKRRDWPMKVIKEMKDILLILDANGRLKHASPAIFALTGYTQDEMVEVFLRDIIHPDDVGVFVAEMNESIATGTPLQIFFRLKKKDGSYQIFEAVGHAHIAAAKYAPNPSNQSAFCQAVFMMARPYPTKNTGLLDSFLEHKIENERLKRRIAELRKEEADEAEESQRTWRQSQEGRSEMGQSEDTYNSMTTPVYQGSVGDHSMRPPEKPSLSNNSLTRENLEGMSGARPDSIRDKMARYEGTSHADTIEMLTGLRYQEGERSKGITTGNASPTLIRGDAGIAIPVDRDPRTGEKKKKLKVAEEYVCTDCGTLDSPEWRKGPSGPKTLCNACGLRWAKKEKKMKNSAGGAAGMSMMESH